MLTSHNPERQTNEPVYLVSNSIRTVQTIVGAAQSRNREFAAVSTRESCTWPTAVHEVTITAFAEAATTATLNLLGVCFDAPNDAVAAAWLTHADSTATDSNLFAIPIGQPRTFYFSGNGITRLDVIRLYGSDAIGVIVEAA